MFESLTTAIDLALSYGVLITCLGIASLLVIGAAKKWLFK